MSTKKCKPLGSAMEEFVFGTKEKEAASPPTPDVVSSAPQASQEAQIPPTPLTIVRTVFIWPNGLFSLDFEPLWIIKSMSAPPLTCI